MNIFKKLGDLLSTALGVLLVAWFSAQCIKFGWYARGNSILRPFVANVLGIEEEQGKEGAPDQIRQFFERFQQDKPDTPP
jgi:hypothetical protein